MLTRDLKHFTPFYFYTIVVIFLALIAKNELLSVGRIILLILVGLLSWGFVEYSLHRFAFHYDGKSERVRQYLHLAHLSHHKHPQSVDQLFSSLRTSVPLASLYYVIVWGVVRDWHVTSFIFIGLLLGYFFYEWLHYQAHHGVPRSRLFKYLRAYHLLHHHKSPNKRFGVTSPLVDWLFGTYQPVNLHRSKVRSS
jgi:dihydroceramide fatty acyl 2-hydroxylase